MADEKKRLIQVRVQKSARFKRDGAGKKKQLEDTWRRPRGLHNKQRRQKKAKGALPTPGYGSPVAVRGLHPSGFREVLVATPDELSGLDSNVFAIRIAGAVGARKRAIIQERALAEGLKVLNPHEIKAPVAKPEAEEEEVEEND
jgi:large subunit ribosomal protein L32e